MTRRLSRFEAALPITLAAQPFHFRSQAFGFFSLSDVSQLKY
jgi:hypothetical protein